jgi:hypothetical protein
MKNFSKVFTLIALTFSIVLVSCKKDEKVKADDAKVEIQAAVQDIFYNVAAMASTPQMESMMFLSQLMGLEIDMKSTIQNVVGGVDKYNFVTAKRYLKQGLSRGTLNEIDPFAGGVFTFNFLSGEFDLTNSEVSYLQIFYPANNTAYAAQQNNASLRLDNFEFVEIEYEDEWGTYTEKVPTNADVIMTIDNQNVMSLGFNATFSNEGLPTAASLNMNMQPYQLNLSYSGSGVNYTSNMTYKLNNVDLLRYNLDLAYTSSMDYLDRVRGFIEVVPLRFDGSVQALAMESCDEYDISCLNSNLDVDVIQTEKEMNLGTLEYKMFYDADWDEEYPELAIVFADGSHQFLFEFLGALEDLGKKRITR